MHAIAMAVVAVALCQTPTGEVARRLARGYQLLDRGRAEEAEQELAAVVAADPKSVDARILLGMADYHLGRDSAAIQNLQAALALEPASLQAHYVLGLLYQRKQQYTEPVGHRAEAESDGEGQDYNGG